MSILVSKRVNREFYIKNVQFQDLGEEREVILKGKRTGSH